MGEADKLLCLRQELKAGAMFVELFGETNREARLKPSRRKPARAGAKSLPAGRQAVAPTSKVEVFFIMRWFLHAKIHQATVTEADLKYVGSITIDEELLDKSGLKAGEKVLVVSNTTGARLETYIIAGVRNTGIICMNGASAHLIKQGEEIIIMGFELSDKAIEAKNVLVDKANKFVKYL